METTNNNNPGEAVANKTAVISISAVTFDMVLLILDGNKIEHKVIAIDHEEKTILQVFYKADQQEIINDTIRFMNFFDELAALFLPLLKTALTKFQDKTEQIFKDVVEKHGFKKGLNLGNLSGKKEKQKEHGNVETK